MGELAARAVGRAAGLKSVPTLRRVEEHPELRVIPHMDVAAKLGVSTEVLSDAIRVATAGDVGPKLAKFEDGDRQIPIRVKLADSGRADQQVLEEMRVPNLRGGTEPLAAVADVRLARGPVSIRRYDRERQATIQADLVGQAALGEVLAKINETPVGRPSLQQSRNRLGLALSTSGSSDRAQRRRMKHRRPETPSGFRAHTRPRSTMQRLTRASGR